MRSERFLGVLAASVFLCACGGAEQSPCAGVHFAPPPTVEAEIAALEGLDLDGFVDASFRALLRRDPELVSELGLSASLGLDDSQLTDVSAEAEAAGALLAAGILERLKTFDPAERERRRTRDVFRWFLEDGARQRAYADLDYPFTQMVSSVQSALLLLLADLHPVGSEKNAEDFVNRVCQSGEKIDQLIAAIDRAAANGVIPPRIVIERSLPLVRSVAAARGRELPAHQSFVARLQAVPGIGPSRRAELADAASGALEAVLIPAYRRLEDRLDRLWGAAPTAVGIGRLAHGAGMYEAALRHFTTTTLTPAEISALGIGELDRIHSEMRAQFAALGYPSDEPLSQSYTRLADDGGWLSGPAIAAAYETIIAEATARLDEAFVVVPQSDCVVVPVAGGGFYVGPSIDGARSGAFYAPTTGTVPRFGMRTLAYHEAVPGHHLQIALTMESDLPLVRKALQGTGLVEGWALYAERLVSELGWYAGDPYGDLGRLQMEAFRAARLVVDTGIHHDGWSFEQAHQFMLDNVGPPGTVNLASEVARYVAWPGQATAYMTGMLELLSLRGLAVQQLGPRFSLLAFHDAVLQAGPVPLEVLEEVVLDYIADTP